MRCILCERFSLLHVCKKCQTLFLSPSLYRRSLKSGVDVYSFYKYKDIKELLFTKHTDIGYYIYTILAHNSLKPFAQLFQWQSTPLASIAIDDNPDAGYSHTAILNKALKSHSIVPLYNKLHAHNKVKYSGKSKMFRLQNPRNFRLRHCSYADIILVDDIVTTGTTLEEAIQSVRKQGKNPAFCLTLCDASR